MYSTFLVKVALRALHRGHACNLTDLVVISFVQTHLCNKKNIKEHIDWLKNI